MEFAAVEGFPCQNGKIPGDGGSPGIGADRGMNQATFFSSFTRRSPIRMLMTTQIKHSTAM